VLGGLAATGIFVVVVIGVGFTHGLAGPESTAGSQPAKSVPRPESRVPTGAGGVSQPNKMVGLPSAVHVAYGKAQGQRRDALVYTSSKDFTRRNIAAGVRSAVSSDAILGTINEPGHVSAPSPSATTHRHAPSAPPKVGGVSVGQIAGCLTAVAVSNGVLVVEIAHYQGKPAIIIVSRPVGNLYRVTVAGLACSTSRPDVLARITVPKAR